MTACETCRPALLDHRFGLLDAAEAVALDAHLAGCADCRAAAVEAERVHRLIAAAARADFPVPPIKTLIQTPGRRAAGPLDPTRTVRAALTQWLVAASLLLATCGLIVPTVRDAAGHWRHAPVVKSETAAVAEAAATGRRLGQEILANRAAAADRTRAARVRHDQVVEEWVAAEEKNVIKASAAQPLSVFVAGPVSAVAGAPNEYEVTVNSRGGRTGPVRVSAEVTDANGTKLFTQTLPDTTAPVHLVDDLWTSHTPQPVRLPARLWTRAAGSPLTLSITATDPKAGAAGRVTRTIGLAAPIYATFLSTDKPLYRPGEAVYYRSVTLDRAGFRPPADDYPVRFGLETPAGRLVPVPGSEATTVPANPDGTPVAGPDGQPVRGVGTGLFVLPVGLPGGEYTLKVFAPGPGDDFPPAAGSPESVPVAERRFTVVSASPVPPPAPAAPAASDDWIKFDAGTYGPGDTVRAKVTVPRDIKLHALARLDVPLTIHVDGRRRDLRPDAASALIDAAGAAAVTFTLPAGRLTDASLTASVLAPWGNTVIGRVPLRLRGPLGPPQSAVEFYPEGGDLVAGVPGRVYLRATTAAGKPADLRGVLTDGTRDVAAVSTLIDVDRAGASRGLGVVAFTPEAGRRYFVRPTAPAGIGTPIMTPAVRLFGTTVRPAVAGFALPAVKESGVGLTIVPGGVRPGEPLRVKLQAAGGKRAVVVGVYLRGVPLAHRKTNLEPGTPTDLAIDLGPAGAGGVMRVTVFEEPADADADLRPVAERLVFRVPAEVLKLAYTAGRPGDPKSAGAFAPGERVELQVAATDEAGKPKPAVLMAAVVNQSVITGAGDATARRMPAHFLLADEVRHPADLEHADFLLTDNPTAAAALDLLLGTQGWRRFAEQAPAHFRRRGDPAEADRLLAAVGVRGRVPATRDWAARGSYDVFWPGYQAAVAALDRAEAAERDGADVRPLIDDYRTAQRGQQAHAMQAHRAAGDLAPYEPALARRASLWPVTISLAFAAGFALVGVRRRSRSVPERRWLLRGGVGFVGLGAALLALALTATPDREVVAALAWADRNSQYGYSYGGQPAYPQTVLPPGDNGVEAAIAAVERGSQGERATGSVAFAPAANFWGGWEAALTSPTPSTARREPPLAAAAADSGTKWSMSKSAPAPAPAPLDAARPPARRMAESRAGDGSDHRDRFGYVPSSPSRRLERHEVGRSKQPPLTAAKKDTISALDLVRTQVQRLPALVVREYAHARPADAAPGRPRANFAETLLWKPVVVTDAAGKATLPFDLSDAATGYQVLIAGHTTDGRIGAISGTMEVRELSPGPQP